MACVLKTRFLCLPPAPPALPLSVWGVLKAARWLDGAVAPGEPPEEARERAGAPGPLIASALWDPASDGLFEPLCEPLFLKHDKGRGHFRQLLVGVGLPRAGLLRPHTPVSPELGFPAFGFSLLRFLSLFPHLNRGLSLRLMSDPHLPHCPASPHPSNPSCGRHSSLSLLHQSGLSWPSPHIPISQNK